MPIRGVDGPPHGNPLPVGQDRPLPPALRPIRGVLASALPAGRRFVQDAVDRHLGEIKADDPVIRRQRFRGEGVEHPRRDPGIAARADGGVGDLVPTESFRILPGAAGHEADQENAKARLVRDPGPMTAQGMLVNRGGDQGLDGGPDVGDDVRVQGAHNRSGPPFGLGAWV